MDTYIDDGISGVTAHHRPEFSRMITDLKSRRVDTIICKSLSRAFRNSGDQAEYLRVIFPQYKTRFITIDTPHIDTFLTPEKVYDIDISFYGSFNEGYPLMISREINKTFKMMREKGEFTSGFAPYGYLRGDTDTTKNKFFIDEPAAEIVRKIFHLYVHENMSQLNIVRELNRLGIPNPAKYKKLQGLKYSNKYQQNSGLWGISSVSRILKNEAYIGNMVQGREHVISPVSKRIERLSEDEWVIVENTHKPIIDKAVFEKASQIRSVHHRTPRKKRQIDLFSGLLKCHDCGMRMHYKRNIRQNKTGESVYQYYTCSTYAMKSKIACTHHRVKKEILEENVLKAIQNQIAQVTDLEKIIQKAERQKIVDDQQGLLKKQLEQHHKEVQKYQSLSENLYIDWKSEMLNRDEYLRMKCSFDEKVDHAKYLVLSLEKELNQDKDKIDTVTTYLDKIRTYGNIHKLNRPLLLDLIDKIEVHDNKDITIHFKFSEIHQKIVEATQDN